MKIVRPIGYPAIAGLLLYGVVAWAPGASAKTSHCLIINAAANASYSSLQAAQDAASPGATLWVRGTCIGDTTITQDLTITGQPKPGFTGPTLDGGGQGTVLTIDSGVTATVNTLTITGGTGSSLQNELEGGGIVNDGTLTMNNSIVSGNTATASGAGAGGGILNDGSLTMNGGSVSGNSSGGGGGGIITLASLTLNGTSVSDNTTARVGGGIENLRTLTLNGDSSVSDNSSGGFGDGGGIYDIGLATLTVNDSSSISGNHAGVGGGIFTEGLSVTLTGNSTVTGNTAALGGGIASGPTRGVNTITMTGNSTVTGNTASETDGGGGIFGGGATLVGCTAGVNVYNNTPDDIAF